MHFLHTVIDSQCDLFQRLSPALTAHISFTDILCTGYDILFKVMTRLKDLILLAVFIGNTVTQADTRRPDQLGIHHLDDPVEQDTGYKQ